MADTLRRNTRTPVMSRHRREAEDCREISGLHIGRGLALVVRMRRLLITLIALILLIFPRIGSAQETRVEEKPIIESVEIAGVSEGRISRELRERMQELVGQRFDQLAADEVAFEIQNRLSERISAIRELPGSDAQHIRVVFEVGNVNVDEDRDSNINSRYIVEDVELRGVSESLISDSLLADMRRLVGQNLAHERAEGILRRLRRELRPTRLVEKRVTRGNDRDHVRIIFEVERAPLLKFQKFGSYALYHSKQGPSFSLDLGFGGHNNRFSFGPVNDGNQLIERDEGFRVGFENIKAGTEYLGFKIDYFDYHLKWKEATQFALESAPDVPGIYRERRGIEPTLTFTFDPRVRFNAGVSISELQIQFPLIHFQNVNAGTGTVTYEDTWNDAGRYEQHVKASYNVRAASNNLDSDFIYTRHFGDVNYSANFHHSEFVGSFMAGTVSGNPPLFDRFSLGNADTLRGWNKYDLDPIGGNRLLYGSLEYRFTVLQLFYDVGSVWDSGQPHKTSHSFGFGLHGRGDDRWFLTFGVPIRSGHIQPLKPLFMMGVRF